MAALKDKVVSDTLAEVEIVYLNRETAKWWNTRRRPDDTAAFTGWFWIKDAREAGPFKTRSAALRDAYYRFVVRRETPSIGHAALPGPKKPLRKGIRLRSQEAAR